MSVQEKFKSEWLLKFPTESTPDLTSFYGDHDQIDVAALGKGLQKSNELIAELNLKLRRQEFISEFLWETIHNYKKNHPELEFVARTPRLFPSVSSIVDESSSLDEPIPLQDVSTVSFSPVVDEGYPSGQNSPYSAGSLDTSLDNARSSLLVKQHSADCILSASDSRLPYSQGGIRKKSVPLLDWDEERRLADSTIHDENRTRSLDSGRVLFTDMLAGSKSTSNKQPTPPLSTFRPNRPELPLPTQTPAQVGLLESVLRGKKPKPVPAPRTSIMKPNTKVEMSLVGGDGCIGDVHSSPSPSPTADAGIAKDGTAGLKKLMRSFQNDRSVAVAVASRRGHSSMKNLQVPPMPSTKPTVDGLGTTDLPRPRLHTLDSPVLRPQSSESNSNPGLIGVRSPKASSTYDPGDYEEAMPVQRDFVESTEASSDEDEPLYYNLMLLKEQTLSRVATLYSKRDSRAKPGNAGAKIHPGAYQKLGYIKETDQTNSGLSGDSVRSIGSDSVFEEKSGGQGWRKRRSMYVATDSVDSQSECDELDTALPLCPEDEKLQMRKWVVTSILESEHSYLNILDILMQYMQTFKNLLGSAQAVISATDIETIFSKIPDLHLSHKMFVHDLEPKVENWSSDQQIADIFRILALAEFSAAPLYLKNYQKAVTTIHRCWQENIQFATLTKEIQVKGMKEKPSLEELLHKPVVRFQRNTLVLHDLVKCTPTSHADYDTLMKTLQLAQNFLEKFENKDNKDNAENQRYLAKQGLVVEKLENTRKLRHLFLFNDILICARQKISGKQKLHFEPKWYIPLIDLTLDDKVCIEEEKLLADCQQQEIEALQRKVSELQQELKSEVKLSKGNVDAQRQWSFHNRTRNLEKIKKKLMEQQAAMIKASPRLLFRVHNRRLGRQYTLLMASDYERSNWRATIAGLLSRAQPNISLSSADLQNLMNSQKLPKFSTLAAIIGMEDLSLEEEHLFGNLIITIYRLQGLKQPADTYCAVEIDSFGHFFVKAKTNVVVNSMEPVWNEDFEVDLEGAQTVRILCYKMNRDAGSLIGTCALELSKAWLRGDFQEKNVSVNEEISVTLSLRYCSREQTLKRALSSVKGGLFGAKLRTVTKREGNNIPQVIQTCIEEVDRRGMTEIGIYRVSGVSGEIQRLKKAFEKNTKGAIQLAKEMDINVVTGLLKLYFRELPEALFTDNCYSSFVKGMGLSDPEAKQKYIQSVLDSLPEPNRSTAFYVIDHLIRVAAYEPENKMTLQNLSTVFGPTLLRPAVKEGQQQTLEELFSIGTRDAMMQTSVLLYILNVHAKQVSVV